MNKLPARHQVIKLLLDFFKGDINKVADWMKEPNHLLGNMSPNEMILHGREEKLLNFVYTSINENFIEEYKKVMFDEFYVDTGEPMCSGNVFEELAKARVAANDEEPKTVEELLDKLTRSIQQAKEGKLVDKGSFSQYISSPG